MCARRKDEDKQRVGDQVSDHRQNLAGINTKNMHNESLSNRGNKYSTTILRELQILKASSLDLRTFFLFAIECTFFLAFVENMKSNESRSEFQNNKHV